MRRGVGHFDPEGPAHTRYTLVLSAQTEAVCDPVWGIGRSALVGVSQFEIRIIHQSRDTDTHNVHTAHKTYGTKTSPTFPKKRGRGCVEDAYMGSI